MTHKDGSRGRELHKDITDYLSNSCPYEAAKIIGDDWLIFPTTNEDGDKEMADVLGTHGIMKASRKGGYFPDVIWEFWQRNDEDFAVAVEVGKYEPDRCPVNNPVIHVGFNGKVSLINPRDILEFNLLKRTCDAVERLVGDRFPYLRDTHDT